ncbi:uncharacterized protein LOC100368454 [Saccoglossus kowalevskii]|uniref:Uncharacterized protein LOC100368454 n=1 Tax=Saccoglossus kowalevskii TaxID=10224 RepID=A0ABM0N127_SACKO|nr:PREDICTED: uncharacterized protein LOC100368454 [Saccoglossus kowalevskii]
MLSRCIVASNIPRNATAARLRAYFQEKQNGGGDVTNIVYPLEFEDSDTAVVTFSDENKVDSVVKITHVFHGCILSVRPLLLKSKVTSLPTESRVSPKRALSPTTSTNQNGGQGPIVPSNVSDPDININERCYPMTSEYIKITARMSTGGRRKGHVNVGHKIHEDENSCSKRPLNTDALSVHNERTQITPAERTYTVSKIGHWRRQRTWCKPRHNLSCRDEPHRTKSATRSHDYIKRTARMSTSGKLHKKPSKFVHMKFETPQKFSSM